MEKSFFRHYGGMLIPDIIKRILYGARFFGKSTKSIFSQIYSQHYWNSSESLSGPGSDWTEAEILAKKLPEIIEQLQIKSMLDIPCGDFNWMSRVNLKCAYIGADIVPKLILSNRSRFRGVDFRELNLITDPLPPVDLIFCRDCLVHLSFADISKMIANLKIGNCKYFAATTFTRRKKNVDIHTGDWRPLNLQIAPFNFPSPVLLIDEQCTAGDNRYRDKSMGVWRMEDIRNIK